MLHDSPVRDTSLALTTPTIEAVRPPSVSTTEIVPFLSPDIEAKTYRRKTISHKVKTIEHDVGSSFSEMSHHSSDSERTQSEDCGGDFMDTTVDSCNVAGSSMVRKEIAEVGEIRDVVDHGY